MHFIHIFILLLSIGVLFNPPYYLQSALLHPNIAQADIENNFATFSEIRPQFRVVVNIPSTELRLYEEEALLKSFPIAVGQKQHPTPIGKKDGITKIVWNPWWYPPESDWAKDAEITPPGPKNPLGPVKMFLSDDILLHGTNQERSIGRAASHACIRMRNSDAKNLAWLLQSYLTPYQDPKLLEKYAQKRSRTFSVELNPPVPISFTYETIETKNEILFLHKDLYGKMKNKKEALLHFLKQNGIRENQINNERLDQIVHDWQKGKPNLQTTFLELLKTG